MINHWIPHRDREDDLQAGSLRVVVDQALPATRSLMILELADGGGVVRLTPAQAAGLELTAGSVVSAPGVHAGLRSAGVAMHDPDYLFYLPVEEQSVILGESAAGGTRQLTEGDAEVFKQFAELAPADDMDEAFVELHHWLVCGTFDGAQLVCVASMYPWEGTQLADLGVITLPECRGRGLAKRTVRAISAHALAQGYEPQYRCQLDNDASVALAQAAGFVRFGTWHVIEPDD